MTNNLNSPLWFPVSLLPTDVILYFSPPPPLPHNQPYGVRFSFPSGPYPFTPTLAGFSSPFRPLSLLSFTSSTSLTFDFTFSFSRAASPSPFSQRSVASAPAQHQHIINLSPICDFPKSAISLRRYLMPVSRFFSSATPAL